jgi:hypothetical protein
VNPTTSVTVTAGGSVSGVRRFRLENGVNFAPDFQHTPPSP